jgi:hypothetical protein
MSLIPKIGVGLQEETLSQNINFLSPLGFRFLLNRTPNVEYFCQSATLPTISMSELIQPTPFVNIPRPGDKIVYEPLTLRFRVDENMTNYLEIFNWIISLGKPENFNQYQEKLSDGSILLLSSNNNPKIRIAFQDMFPLSLSPLNFDVTQADVEYLEADVMFRYRIFTVENL